MVSSHSTIHITQSLLKFEKKKNTERKTNKRTWRVSPPSPIRWRSMLSIGCRNCSKAIDSTFFKLLIACIKFYLEIKQKILQKYVKCPKAHAHTRQKLPCHNFMFKNLLIFSTLSTCWPRLVYIRVPTLMQSVKRCNVKLSIKVDLNLMYEFLKSQ